MEKQVTDIKFLCWGIRCIRWWFQMVPKLIVHRGITSRCIGRCHVTVCDLGNMGQIGNICLLGIRTDWHVGYVGFVGVVCVKKVVRVIGDWITKRRRRRRRRHWHWGWCYIHEVIVGSFALTGWRGVRKMVHLTNHTFHSVDTLVAWPGLSC